MECSILFFLNCRLKMDINCSQLIRNIRKTYSPRTIASILNCVITIAKQNLCFSSKRLEQLSPIQHVYCNNNSDQKECINVNVLKYSHDEATIHNTHFFYIS